MKVWKYGGLYLLTYFQFWAEYLVRIWRMTSLEEIEFLIPALPVKVSDLG